MAKRVKTRVEKRAVKKVAKRADVSKQAARPNLLGVIRGAIVHQAARPILGRLSGDDLDILAKHMSAGTLMLGLTPLADTASKDDAVSAMPQDIGNIIARLPATDVTALHNHLKRLDRDENDAVVCPC
jgi:hypothetical protein